MQSKADVDTIIVYTLEVFFFFNSGSSFIQPIPHAKYVATLFQQCYNG